MLLTIPWILALMWLQLPSKVRSHARLMSPPSRSSMWRLGFPTKKNFNDNELYCGGLQVQWKRNGGKCGICGDPYDRPQPRDNEAGGKYGQGIITRKYLSGQIIEATVAVTTNHKGYFEFKLCPNNNPKKIATQECLDKYTLKLADGSDTKYFIGGKGNGNISVKLQLPKGLTCSQCVLQWTYTAGNNWGHCKDGKSRLGCGPQETFRGCADIAISKNIGLYAFWPSKNDIRPKQQTNSFDKDTKQNYFKDTSISKYPKYALDTSKQMEKDWNNGKLFSKRKNDLKPTTWHTTDSSDITTVLPTTPTPNLTSQKVIDSWTPLNLHKYFENWKGVDSPTAEEIFLGKSGTEQDIFSALGTPKLIDNGDSKISAHYRPSEGDIELLKFYLQDPISGYNQEERDYDTSTEFNFGGSRYKDFWYL